MLKTINWKVSQHRVCFEMIQELQQLPSESISPLAPLGVGAEMRD
jgi:hypothetical protein